MKPADSIILAIAFSLIAYLYMTFWDYPSLAGQLVEISNSDGIQFRLPLSRDRLITIDGRKGQSVIEIHDGKVRFKDSPCQQKRCMHRGWLHQASDFMACLPNQVMIYITGKQRLDSIVY